MQIRENMCDSFSVLSPENGLKLKMAEISGFGGLKANVGQSSDLFHMSPERTFV